MPDNDPATEAFQWFEIIAIDPSRYNKRELLAAFKAGNIALTSALMAGGERASRAVREWDDKIEYIGCALINAPEK